MRQERRQIQKWRTKHQKNFGPPLMPLWQLCKEGDQHQKGVAMATLNQCTHGDITPSNWQGGQSISLRLYWRNTCGNGGCLKTKDTWLAWNPCMGGIWIATKQEVHATPLGASRWDGALGTHSRRQQGFFGHLCLGLQSNVPLKMSMLGSWFACMGWSLGRTR